jgi:hypothetical protein
LERRKKERKKERKERRKEGEREKERKRKKERERKKERLREKTLVILYYRLQLEYKVTVHRKQGGLRNRGQLKGPWEK